MNDSQHDELMVGAWFWDGHTNYYKVTNYNRHGLANTTSGERYIVEVDVDVYEANNLANPVERKRFRDMSDIHPLIITEALLTASGFVWLTHPTLGYIFTFDNAYYTKMVSSLEYYTIYQHHNKVPSGVKYVHQAQLKTRFPNP